MACEWAGATPLLLGGDFNLRPRRRASSRIWPTASASSRPDRPDSIDHLLVRGLEIVDRCPRAWPPAARERPGGQGLAIRLSDHAPVEARFAQPKKISPAGRRNEIVRSPHEPNRGHAKEEFDGDESGRFQVKQVRAATRVERLEVERARSRAARGRAPRRGAGRRADGLGPAAHPGGARRQGRAGIPGCARAKRSPSSRDRLQEVDGRRRPARSHRLARDAEASSSSAAWSPGAAATPTTWRKELERLLDQARRELGSRTRPTRRRATQAAGRAARAARDAADAPLAQADRLRRARRGFRRGTDHGLRPAHGEPGTKSRLGDLSPAELRQLRQREKSGKARKGVLAQIDRQLSR